MWCGRRYLLIWDEMKLLFASFLWSKTLAAVDDSYYKESLLDLMNGWISSLFIDIGSKYPLTRVHFNTSMRANQTSFGKRSREANLRARRGFATLCLYFEHTNLLQCNVKRLQIKQFQVFWAYQMLRNLSMKLTTFVKLSVFLRISIGAVNLKLLV